MDIESHFNECVVVAPRRFPLCFRCRPTTPTHYAMVGTAVSVDGYPLYSDAMNEKGVCAAGLHFPGNAVYAPFEGDLTDTHQVAPFELIPYLLGYCADLREIKNALSEIRVSDIHFSREVLNTPLHWHIAARDGSLVLEVTAKGMTVYDDPYGVLTNNPPYPYHKAHIYRYQGLSCGSPRGLAHFSDTPEGDTYDLGLGMVGLPGDYTSPARFVRCATLRRFTDWAVSGEAAVARFEQILGAVAVPAGCVKTESGRSHATLYTCCMDSRTLTYHVRHDQKITPLSVRLTEERCDGDQLWETRF